MKRIAHCCPRRLVFQRPTFSRLALWLLLCAAGLFCSAVRSQTPCVNDEQLQNMSMRSGNDTGTLVYVWSPRMVLSLTQAHLAAQAAAQLGLDFFPLRDARVPDAEITEALNAARAHNPEGAAAVSNSSTLCATELIQAQALRHFPTAFVLTARGTHRWPIVGAMPLTAWQRSITQRLATP
jgi:hypothetical protein